VGGKKLRSPPRGGEGLGKNSGDEFISRLLRGRGKHLACPRAKKRDSEKKKRRRVEVQARKMSPRDQQWSRRKKEASQARGGDTPGKQSERRVTRRTPFGRVIETRSEGGGKNRGNKKEER